MKKKLGNCKDCEHKKGFGLVRATYNRGKLAEQSWADESVIPKIVSLLEDEN